MALAELAGVDSRQRMTRKGHVDRHAPSGMKDIGSSDDNVGWKRESGRAVRGETQAESRVRLVPHDLLAERLVVTDGPVVLLML